MTSPEERERRRKRIKNHVAKDLRTPKYRQRTVKPKEYNDRKIRVQDIDSNGEVLTSD